MMHRFTRSAEPDDGLTLVEMVIALALTAMVALFTAAVLIGAMKARATTEARDRGNQVANEWIERASLAPWNELGLSPEDAPDTDTGETTVVVADTPWEATVTSDPEQTGAIEYVTTINVEWVGSAGGSVPDENYGRKRVTVTTTWELQGEEFQVTTSTVRSPTTAEQSPPQINAGVSVSNTDCVVDSPVFCLIEITQGGVLVGGANDAVLGQPVNINVTLRPDVQLNTAAAKPVTATVDSATTVELIPVDEQRRTWVHTWGAATAGGGGAHTGVTPGTHTVAVSADTAAGPATQTYNNVLWWTTMSGAPLAVDILNPRTGKAASILGTDPICVNSDGVTVAPYELWVDVTNLPLTEAGLTVPWTLGDAVGAATTHPTNSNSIFGPGEATAGPYNPDNGLITGGPTAATNPSLVASRRQLLIPQGTPLGKSVTYTTKAPVVVSASRTHDGMAVSASAPLTVKQGASSCPQ